MTTETDPRPRKKAARIVRAEVGETDEMGDGALYGECWAAIDDDGNLIAVGADIKAVTDAAFYSGHRISPQA